MKIPFAKSVFLGKEKEYLSDALASGWVSDGPYVERFEKEFLSYYPGSFGLTTASGTAALHLALLALGIGPGDEVIVPGFTFVAPVNMTLAVGAVPVYADVDPFTWCLDPQSVEKCITLKTKAIIAVHIYGNVSAMPALKSIAAKHRLFLIEDSAQAAFSKQEGIYAGSFSDIACFSFQATKTVVMGEGGFVLTPHQPLADKMRVIRDHGMKKDKRYWHDVIGYNFRLTNLQAAVGCAQLEYVEEIVSRKKNLQKCYEKYLADEEGLILQEFKPSVEPVVWSMAVRIDPKVFEDDRDRLMALLSETGIETRPGFYGFHRLPPYQDRAPRLPVAGTIGEEIILLPCFISLTQEEIELVWETLKKLLKRIPVSAGSGSPPS